jgi:hypothetical protein
MTKIKYCKNPFLKLLKNFSKTLKILFCEKTLKFCFAKKFVKFLKILTRNYCIKNPPK